MSEPNEKILKRAEIEENEAETVAGGIDIHTDDTEEENGSITILRTATGGAFVV